MPTHDEDLQFWRDFRLLSAGQRRRFRRAVAHFVADLGEGRQFRPGLRVKGLTTHPGVFEMTWAPDGRATFSFGEPLSPGDPHVIWRRIGTHAIFERP